MIRMKTTILILSVFLVIAVFFVILYDLWTGGTIRRNAKNSTENTVNISMTGNKGKTKITLAGPDSTPIELSNSSTFDFSGALTIENQLEKHFTDIDFVFQRYQINEWRERLDINIAAGNIPDVMYRWGVIDVINLAKKGILAEVPYDLVKKNAPDIYDAIKELSTEIWFSTMYEGKNYGLPIVTNKYNQINCDAWRKDWLDNVGIEKTPDTIEEMEEAFKRFTYNDPDKNGKNDTYAVCPRYKSWAMGMLSVVYHAFGINPFYFIPQPGGTVKYARITEQSKKVLELLQKWYKKGYIDPEFIITDDEIMSQKFINGKIGYLDAVQWEWYHPLIDSREIYSSLKTVNYKAEIIPAHTIVGPEGKYGFFKHGVITHSRVFGKHLGKNMAKFRRILQVIDQIESQGKLSALVKYGIEGKDWIKKKNNYFELIQKQGSSKEKAHSGILFTSNIFCPLPDVEKNYLKIKAVEEYTKLSAKSNITDGKDYFSWLFQLAQVYFDPAEFKKSGYSGESLGDVEQRWVLDFITGEKSLDQFDTFVNEWLKSGGEYYTKRINEIYNKEKIFIENSEKLFNR